MKKLYVVKIGGNIIDDAAAAAVFLDDFAQIPSPKILIHGGGKKATELSGRLGITSQMVEGRRITDADSLDIVVMVYAGLINKQIVAQLQARGCDALGLSGADAACILAEKRPVRGIDYGFVGDVVPGKTHAARFQQWLEEGLTPVVAPITHDGRGQLLNTNADTMATAVATALAPLYQTELIYCFEKKGVLREVNDESSLIPEISPQGFAALQAAGAVAAGMIPKLYNAFAAIEAGVHSVCIGAAANLKAIVAGEAGAATLITGETPQS